MKREGVRIIETEGALVLENGVISIRFDLKKGMWSAGKCGEEPALKEAYAAAGGMEKQWRRHDLPLDDGGDFRLPWNRPDASR